MNWKFFALLLAVGAATLPVEAAPPQAGTTLSTTEAASSERFEAFARLTLGMSVAEVVAHMGDPSHRRISQVVGVDIATYAWHPLPLLGGEAFEVQFVMGRLTSKSMRSLRFLTPSTA